MPDVRRVSPVPMRDENAIRAGGLSSIVFSTRVGTGGCFSSYPFLVVSMWIGAGTGAMNGYAAIVL